MDIQDIIYKLTELSDEELNSDIVRDYKKEFAKANNHSELPTNIQLLKTYQDMVGKNKILKNQKIKKLLVKRKIRSESGIVPVQVMTKPYTCPGQCIFCPNDASMPKSYINTEPGAMRALLNEFDPIKQVYNRLLSLRITGHNTDKIEMIILGGTWDVYPKDYKIDFVKKLFDAVNTFEDFFTNVDLNLDNPKSAKFTVLDDQNIQYSNSLQKAQDINENAHNRIIGLTIETRPEFVNHENCRFWRMLGVTRIEMGVQSLFDNVLQANKRGHNVEQVKQAVHMMRSYGFKISLHIMPGLYKSDISKDIQTIRILYEDKYLKPDEIKFYPTSVLPNTELYNIYTKGNFKPLDNDDLIQIIEQIKLNYIPPYTRIKRLIRDIPAQEIIAGSDITNLRQIVYNNMIQDFQENVELREKQYSRLYPNFAYDEDVYRLLDKSVNSQVDDDKCITYINAKSDIQSIRKFICLCTRCREIRHNSESNQKAFLVIRKYKTSIGEEYFISYEDKFGYLYGFARLSLPIGQQSVDFEGLGNSTSLLRELHVYGSVASLKNQNIDKVQHRGIGSQLMYIAEQITILSKYKRISVISGIGVRNYYNKLGYRLDGTYMVKDL